MKKTELRERISVSHQRLMQALAGLSNEAAEKSGGLNSNWSVKDALAHISAWEIEGARIIREIQDGTWQPRRLNREAIDEFNRQAVANRTDQSITEARAEFDSAHKEIERLIESLPDEVDEASPTYKYIEAVTFKHLAHHAAQIEEFKKGVEG